MEESNGKAGNTPSALPNRRDKRTPMVLLTRKVEFAASNLYHNPNLSAEENRRIFWKMQQSPWPRAQLHLGSNRCRRTGSGDRHGPRPERAKRDSRTRSHAAHGSPPSQLRGGR